MIRPIRLLPLFVTSLAFGQTHRVCISVDDLPVVSYGIADTTFQKQLTDNLIHSIRDNHIPAIGFVIGQKLVGEHGVSPFQLELLSRWLDAGLELGNHTYSHLDYNSVTLAQYEADLLKGEKVMKGLLESRGAPLRYFRYPFLHTGDSKAREDSLSAFLRQRGYTNAPVTIDNEDYLFAHAYHTARLAGDSSLMLRIGHDYVGYMEKKTKYFSTQSEKLFGRDISQILLIHASLLNSVYLDSLAAMLRQDGYEFISMDQALEDEAYKSEVTVFGRWGISWLDRWAMSRGKKKDFFRDEPLTPDYIRKMSE